MRAESVSPVTFEFFRTIGEDIAKGLLLFIPTHDHAQPQRLMINQPLHYECDAWSLGAWRADGLKITLLARAQSLTIFTIGVDATGIQALCRAHHKEAAMAIHVSQIGQMEIPTVGQEQSAFEALRLR